MSNTERMTDERFAELYDDESNWEADKDLVYELWNALEAERAQLTVENKVVQLLASDVYHQLRMRGNNHLDYDPDTAEEPEIEAAARKYVEEMEEQ